MFLSDIKLELFNKFFKKPKCIPYWKKRLKGKGISNSKLLN